MIPLKCQLTRAPVARVLLDWVEEHTNLGRSSTRPPRQTRYQCKTEIQDRVGQILDLRPARQYSGAVLVLLGTSSRPSGRSVITVSWHLIVMILMVHHLSGKRIITVAWRFLELISNVAFHHPAGNHVLSTFCDLQGATL